MDEKVTLIRQATRCSAQLIVQFISFTYLSKLAELGTRSFFPGSLSAQFLSMDRYHFIAHFADFQVRSSLNRSISGLLLEKNAKTLDRS